MDVHCDDSVTELERLEIGLWIDLHDTDSIDTIVVGNRVVAVHGTSNPLGVVGTAVRLEDGRITAVGPRAALPPYPAAEANVPETVLSLPGRLLLPGGVNAHNHSFQSLLRGLGDDLDFMGWRDRVLYPFSRRLDASWRQCHGSLRLQRRARSRRRCR